MIDRDMAEFIGIAESTFNKWKIDHPEFAAALERGKKVPDDEVVAALMKSAMGYFVDEITQHRNATGEVTSTTLAHRWIVPSVGAQCFWLKNRDPEIWRDRHEIAVDLESSPLKLFAEGMTKFTLLDNDKNRITD